MPHRTSGAYRPADRHAPLPRRPQLCAELAPIPYAALLVATNWAAGRHPGDNTMALSHEEVCALGMQGDLVWTEYAHSISTRVRFALSRRRAFHTPTCFSFGHLHTHSRLRFGYASTQVSECASQRLGVIFGCLADLLHNSTQ